LSKREEVKKLRAQIKQLEYQEKRHDEESDIRSNLSSRCRTRISEIDEEIARIKSPPANTLRIKDEWKDNQLDKLSFDLWEEYSNTWKYNYSFDDCRKFVEKAKQLRLHLTRCIRNLEESIELDA
jgi:hypothetical protein